MGKHMEREEVRVRVSRRKGNDCNAMRYYKTLYTTKLSISISTGTTSSLSRKEGKKERRKEGEKERRREGKKGRRKEWQGKVTSANILKKPLANRITRGQSVSIKSAREK